MALAHFLVLSVVGVAVSAIDWLTPGGKKIPSLNLARRYLQLLLDVTERWYDATLAPGEYHHYGFNVTEEYSELNIDMKAGEGDPDLYLRWNELPTKDVYGRQSSQL